MAISKDPAFLFYSSDFLTGTMILSDEQVGKYIRLLCLQHQKGHLTKKDMLFICKTYDEDIYNKFKTDANDKYYNERLEIEIYKRKIYSDSRRKNRTGKTKDKFAENKEHVNNICKSYDEHMENENENRNEDVKEIINYLNIKVGTSYKNTSKKNKELIQARFNESYSVDDFKTVIDKKYTEWHGTEWEKFLRPETLFSNKFEGYLNQKTKSERKAVRF